MKKVFAFVVITALILSFTACKQDPHTDFVPEVELPEDTKVTLQFLDPGAAFYEHNFYNLNNEDSKALLDILEGFTYDGELCKCDPPYKVYIGNDENYTYRIDISEDSPHVKAFGAQYEMTEAEAESIRDIIYRYRPNENHPTV